MIDHVLAGRYRLDSKLASGGMGSVYRATQLGLGRNVAVKLLTMGGIDALGRFQREAQVLAHLEHPGIVKVHDFGVDEGQAFLVMELVTGTTLEQLIIDQGAPTLGRFVAIATAILEALTAAHGAGVVHRDLKPANVMLRGGPEGTPVLLDFGIARLEVAGESALTQVGMVMGTAAYMSPEQARGEVVDARADLYSVACLFYELLSGRPPFEAVAMADILASHLYREPLPLMQRQLLRPVPAALDACLLKALSKRPQDRFESAAAFAAALKAAAEGGPARGEAKKGRPAAAEPQPLVLDRTVRVKTLGSGGTAVEREMTQNALAVAGLVATPDEADVELLILTPEDDVISAAKAQLAQSRGVPLVLCVHEVDPLVIAAAVSAGVYDVVRWPPEPTRLVRKLVQASRRKKP